MTLPKHSRDWDVEINRDPTQKKLKLHTVMKMSFMSLTSATSQQLKSLS